MYAIIKNGGIDKFVSGENYGQISFGASATIEDRKDAGLYFVVEGLPDLTKYQRLGNEKYVINEASKTATKTYEIIELNHEEIDREEFKIERQAAVDNLEVTHNGVVYQGDEISQGRMARAILVMGDADSIRWIAKDNSPHELTKVELQAMLRLAGQKQSEIWIKE